MAWNGAQLSDLGHDTLRADHPGTTGGADPVFEPVETGVAFHHPKNVCLVCDADHLDLFCSDQCDRPEGLPGQNVWADPRYRHEFSGLADGAAKLLVSAVDRLGVLYPARPETVS